MKKILITLLSVIMIVSSLIGCNTDKSNESTEKETVTCVVPDGITAVAVADFIKKGQSDDSKYKLDATIEKTSENVVSAVMKGETNIAVVPSNVCALENSKNSKYKIAGTIGWGSLYLVSTDGPKSLDELKNNEIYNLGKGLTPDIVMKSILKDKGYKDTDFNFSYVNGVTELAPMVIGGKAKYAVLPEPALTQVSLKNKNAEVILDLNSEWKQINNSEYGFPQSTLIINQDFYEKNKDLADNIIKDVQESCKFAVSKDSNLPDICEEIGVSTNKDIIIKSIDKANISFTNISDCKNEYSTYYKKLFDFDKSTVGGKVPNEDIFLQ